MFVRQLPETTASGIELRLCIGQATSAANVGLTALTIETSTDGELRSFISIYYGFTVKRVVFPAGVSFTTAFDLQPSQGNCPSPWVFDATAQACTAPFGPGCHSVFANPAAAYSYVRGTVVGAQFGSTCAFGPNARPGTVEGECLAPTAAGSTTVLPAAVLTAVVLAVAVTTLPAAVLC